MKEAVPTIEELLAAVRADDDTHGRTTEEWAIAWGVGKDKAREVIKRGLAEGRMISMIETRPMLMRPGYTWNHVIFVPTAARSTKCQE